MSPTHPSPTRAAVSVALLVRAVRSAGALVPTSPVVLRAVRHRVLAWAVVLAATVLVLHEIRSAESVRRAWGPTAEVVVLTRAVPRGQRLTGDDVTRRRLPRRAVPDGAVPSLPAPARAAADLTAGQVLTATLVDRARHGATAAALPVGTRGVVVSTGSLRPPVTTGDRVDVVAGTVDPDGTGGDPTALAREAVVIGRDGDRVTLAVREDDAPTVAAASLAGPLALVIAG